MKIIFFKSDDSPPNYHHTQHLYQLFHSVSSLYYLLFHFILLQIELDPKNAEKINTVVSLPGWFVKDIPLQELSSPQLCHKSGSAKKICGTNIYV